ncbi:hypothetical protein KIPB_001505 [Kipferlia bialata]|uniref:N-acetyltransferase domain-containing protein n=1 Tax=Kipferlia bialata TaxID=797122 RepID=A0A9K3CP05_9EUKA|nr:hypothetical protein KIPB_001505 [Kipferlia bialata]|eukprot:g1505.t1
MALTPIEVRPLSAADESASKCLLDGTMPYKYPDSLYHGACGMLGPEDLPQPEQVIGFGAFFTPAWGPGRETSGSESEGHVADTVDPISPVGRRVSCETDTPHYTCDPEVDGPKGELVGLVIARHLHRNRLPPCVTPLLPIQGYNGGCYIMVIAVKHNARHRGVASSLLRALEDECRGECVLSTPSLPSIRSDLVFLHCRSRSTIQSFYEGQGYHRYGEVEEDFYRLSDDADDALLYAKLLTPGPNLSPGCSGVLWSWLSGMLEDTGEPDPTPDTLPVSPADSFGRLVCRCAPVPRLAKFED